MCMWKCKCASPCTVDSLCTPRQTLDDVREAAHSAHLFASSLPAA